jgi:hypothetical protein
MPNYLLSEIYDNINTLHQYPELPNEITSIAVDLIDVSLLLLFFLKKKKKLRFYISFI